MMAITMGVQMFLQSQTSGDRQQVLDSRIVEYLTANGRQSRTSINRECLHGKVTKAELDASLSRLLATAPPKIIRTREARSQGVGSPTTFYALAESANSANREPDQPLRLAAHGSEVSEVSEVSEAREVLDSNATSSNSEAALASAPEFAESA